MAPPMTFGGIDSAGAVDDAFWTWATAEGVEAVSCAPALFREGWRGVAATGDVAPGDVVLRVPGSLLMSARSACLLYTSPSPRDGLLSRMPSSA